jgi:hypothetical protein
MTLRVIGAGLGRTGTMSLKVALEKLLGGRCYHMVEVFSRPDDIPLWHDVVRGGSTGWDAFFEDYVATVDLPGCVFWRELGDAYPDALILLSSRDDAEAWFRSVDDTAFEALRRDPPKGLEAWHAMATDLARIGFTENFSDRDEAIAAYRRWNDEVRAETDPARLIDWRPQDGWGPLCVALGVSVPDEPFPHLNTTSDFRARAGW